MRNLNKSVHEQFKELSSVQTMEQLLEKRYEKFRKIGIFAE